MVLRERGAAGGGHLADARLDRPGHVEVALHQDDAALAPHRVLGPAQAVERPALLVDGRLGRVQVLGLAAVERARAEGHDLPALVEDREDRAVAEAVVVPALVLPLEDQAGLEEERRRELLSQRAEQVVPRIGSGAGPDPLQRLLLEAAAEQVLARPRPRRGPEVVREVLGGRLQQGQHLLARLAVGAAVEPAFGDGHAEAAGDHLHRLGEADPLVQHRELEDVASFAAAEAVEQGRLRAHVEGRRLLLMEGAQALP